MTVIFFSKSNSFQSAVEKYLLVSNVKNRKKKGKKKKNGKRGKKELERVTAALSLSQIQPK